MLLQEEEEQEGQEGEGRHGNEEPERRRGKFHQWRPITGTEIYSLWCLREGKLELLLVFMRLLCTVTDYRIALFGIVRELT